MESLQIGNIYPPLIGAAEAAFLDYDNAGITLMVGFKNPTSSEIKQFESGKDFRLNFVVIDDVIMFTMKIGDLNWMDAPYTPHLSKSDWIEVETDTQGYALTLMLVDLPRAIIKSIRLIGLGNSFSKSLYKAVKEVESKPFNKAIYDMKINDIMNKYTTSDIVKMTSYKNKYTL